MSDTATVFKTKVVMPKEEYEALKADADRYQWIIDNHRDFGTHGQVGMCKTEHGLQY